MDKLAAETTSSSILPSTNSPDTQRSLLTTSRPNSPQTGLPSTEPNLRFPRPQGNRRLANWISTSNPDMMHVTAGTEDSDLAGSAFELINPVDTDSHDDQYTGSISESVGSLDFHRPDDAQSLTGTEHTYDDDSVIDDDPEPLSRSMIHEEAVDVHNGNHVPLQDGFDDSESEEEARSRSSLEYTQHSLKTPSILTPEASKIMERSFEATDKPKAPEDPWLKGVYGAATRFWDYTAAGAVSAALPGFIFAALFTLLITFLYPSPVQFAKNTKPVAFSTITATNTPVAIYTSRSTSTPTPAQQTAATAAATTSAKGMGLIVLNERASKEWLFRSKKPEIQFTPLRHGTIMVHVASDVTRAWSKKDCLSIAAGRDTEPVKVEYTQSNEGFAVKFPKNETHGVVKLMMQATCRPTVAKAVKIHFGKGIMEEAYEMTKNFASDISGFVPAAAHEAEKRLVGAKKSFCAVSDTVLIASDSLLCRIKDSTCKMRELLGEQPLSLANSARGFVTKVLPLLLESIRKQATEPLASAPALKTSIKEGILNAQLCLVTTQISAKMWWLGVTGQKNERDEYGQKAKTFLDSVRTKGRNKIRRFTTSPRAKP